jgi:hypothetical protein
MDAVSMSLDSLESAVKEIVQRHGGSEYVSEFPKTAVLFPAFRKASPSAPGTIS